MHMATFKYVGKHVLRIGLPLVVLAIFSYYVRRDWNELTAYKFEWNPWLLVLSFLGFVLQELSYGLIWRSILARLGTRLDLRPCLRIYLASEFVRYIPGNVWHVLTRILWVGKYGVSRPVAFASMMVELVTKLAAGLLIFAVSLLFWSDMGAINSFLHGTPFVVGIGIGIMLALLVGLHPHVLNGLLNVALRLFKRDPVMLTLRYSDILLVTLAWCASWFVAGCAFYTLLLALWPNTPLAALPICIGIYAIAWDVGFMSFVTPSGLVFREGAIIGLFALSLPLPFGLSAILAVLSRFVSTIAELVCVSIAYVSGGRQVRAVQQEHIAEAPMPGRGTEKKGNTAALLVTSSEADSRISIEGGIKSD